MIIVCLFHFRNLSGTANLQTQETTEEIKILIRGIDLTGRVAGLTRNHATLAEVMVDLKLRNQAFSLIDYLQLTTDRTKHGIHIGMNQLHPTIPIPVLFGQVTPQIAHQAQHMVHTNHFQL